MELEQTYTNEIYNFTIFSFVHSFGSLFIVLIYTNVIIASDSMAHFNGIRSICTLNVQFYGGCVASPSTIARYRQSIAWLLVQTNQSHWYSVCHNLVIVSKSYFTEVFFFVFFVSSFHNCRSWPKYPIVCTEKLCIALHFFLLRNNVIGWCLSFNVNLSPISNATIIISVFFLCLFLFILNSFNRIRLKIFHNMLMNINLLRQWTVNSAMMMHNKIWYLWSIVLDFVEDTKSLSNKKKNIRQTIKCVVTIRQTN